MEPKNYTKEKNYLRNLPTTRSINPSYQEDISTGINSKKRELPETKKDRRVYSCILKEISKTVNNGPTQDVSTIYYWNHTHLPSICILLKISKITCSRSSLTA